MAAKRIAVAAMLMVAPVVAATVSAPLSVAPALAAPISASTISATLATLAMPAQLALVPDTSKVSFRAYAMGIVPMDGAFRKFHGTLAITAADPLSCRIDVEVEVGSLAMNNPDRTGEVLAPDLLDAADYPRLAYHGVCAGDSAAGTLTMHGETHPLTLKVEQDGALYTASASIRRADWGVRGRPMAAGATVRIRFSTRAP